MRVTESIELTLDEHLRTQWLARCPLCPEVKRKPPWKAWHASRKNAELALNKHLKTHGEEQGSFL